MSHLFITHSGSVEAQGGVWLIDSGCLNHMTGSRDLFQKLDETVNQTVRSGDDKEMRVLGERYGSYKYRSWESKASQRCPICATFST